MFTVRKGQGPRILEVGTAFRYLVQVTDERKSGWA